MALSWHIGGEGNQTKKKSMLTNVNVCSHKGKGRFGMHTRANKQKSTQSLNFKNSIEATIIRVAKGPGPPNQNAINKKM